MSRTLAEGRSASCALIWKVVPVASIPEERAAADRAAAMLVNQPTRTRPDDERNLDVRAALAMSPMPDRLEVYVGWASQPVSVALRRNVYAALRWEVAAPLLRERTLAALAPLHAAGWQLDGPFPVATRWDMSRGDGGDLYEGCWVRMRRLDPE